MKSNQTIIAEWGWFLFNCNLLTYTIIQSSMTKEEAEVEVSDTITIILPLHKHVEITDLTDPSTEVLDPIVASKPIPDGENLLNSPPESPHSASTSFSYSTTYTRLGRGSGRIEKTKIHFWRIFVTLKDSLPDSSSIRIRVLYFILYYKCTSRMLYVRKKKIENDQTLQQRRTLK